MRISILAEDQGVFPSYFLGESTFSALVECEGKKVLFDVGAHTLDYNAQLMGVDLEDIDLVVLSHSHWDHTDGLKILARHESKRYGKHRVLLHPKCFEKTYVLYEDVPHYIKSQPDRLSKLDFNPNITKKYIGLPYDVEEMTEIFEVFRSEGPYKITDSILFTGEIPRLNSFESKDTTFKVIRGQNIVPSSVPDDSALIVNTQEGLVILVGCCHAGICNTIDYAKRITGVSKVHAVVGGIHMVYYESERLERTIEFLRAERIRYIYPCHCIDLRALSRFYSEFTIKKVCAGDIIDFEDVTIWPKVMPDSLYGVYKWVSGTKRADLGAATRRDAPQIPQQPKNNTARSTEAIICPLNGAGCTQSVVAKDDEVFVAHAFTAEMIDDFRSAIAMAIEGLNLKPYYANNVTTQKSLLCKICQEIQSERFGIYDISDEASGKPNPNVTFELGIAYGIGKPALVISKKGSGVTTDLQVFDRLEYASYKDLSRKLRTAIRQLLTS